MSAAKHTPDALIAQFGLDILPEDTLCDVRGLIRASRADLLDVLREIQAMTNESAGEFRKRGGTYRGLVSILVDAAIAKATGAAS